MSLYECKLCLPVFFHLCGVKTHGHKCVVGTRRVQGLQRRHTCPVDIGEHHHIHTGGNSPVDSGALAPEGTFCLPVDIILGHIQMLSLIHFGRRRRTYAGMDRWA